MKREMDDMNDLEHRISNSNGEYNFKQNKLNKNIKKMI